MTGLCPVLVALALAAPAPALAPEDPPPHPDLAAIRGVWTMVEAQIGGRTIAAEQLGGQTLTFAAKTYALKRGDGEAFEEGTFSLDPAKDPREIDLKITKGAKDPDSGEDQVGKTQRGLYKLDGETLVLIFARPGVEKRPKSLEVQPEDEIFLVRLKRRPADPADNPTPAGR